MKKLLMVLILCSVTFWAKAQQKTYGSPEERAQKVTQGMVEELQLSAAQKEQVHEVNLRFARRVQKEIIDTGMSFWNQYSYMKKLDKEKDEALKPLLTEEQFKNYEKLKARTLRKNWTKIFGGA